MTPEIVSLRVTVSGDPLALQLARGAGPGWDATASRDDGGHADVQVHGRHVVALPDATMLVAEGWNARTLPMGGWLMEKVP
ncbi:MAG: hypothetical protein U0163_11630 [Gemmatimonadaceae bacterium]